MMCRPQILLPSYLNWRLLCGVDCGASKFGPVESGPILRLTGKSARGRPDPLVASTIWFWNFKYEKRIVWVKVPVLKSAPTTLCRLTSLLLYTWKLEGKNVANVEFWK